MTNNVKGFIISTVIMTCIFFWFTNYLLYDETDSELETEADVYRSMESDPAEDYPVNVPLSDATINEIQGTVNEPGIQGVSGEEQGDGNDYDEIVNTINNTLNQDFKE